MKAAIHHKLWACLAVCAFLLASQVSAQNLVTGEYFFDEDPGVGFGTEISISPSPIQDFTFNAPVSGLDPGYHYFNIRFLNADGSWGICQTTEFYVNGPEGELPPMAPIVSITQGEYFWGVDPGPGNATPFNLSVGQDVSFMATIPITDNLEQPWLGVRFKDLNGTWGAAKHITVNLDDNTLGETESQDFTYSPDPGVAGNSISFSDQSVGVDPGALFQWDMDGDNEPDYFGANVQHTFAEEGIYSVRQVWVNDPSDLTQSADVLYYFRDESLADEAGLFSDLVPDDISPAIIDGRAGDANGAIYTGPGTLTSTASPSLVDSFTVSFWARGTDMESVLTIGQNDGVKFTAFTVNTAHNLIGTSILAGDPAVMYDGNWHHYLVRYQDGQGESFLDGSLVQSRPVTMNTPFNLDYLRIGGSDVEDAVLGIVDDFTFFKRRLNDDEVQSLYTETYVYGLNKDVQVGEIETYDLNVNGSTTLCEGEVVLLTAPEADAYLWNTGETTQGIVVQNSGSYLCELNLGGMLAITTSVEVTVLPVPQVSITTYDASNGVANGSAYVEASGGNAFSYSYAWSNGSQIELAENLAQGNYSLIVSDGICETSSNFTILDVEATESPRIISGEYFFGADPGAGNGTAFNIPEGEETGMYLTVAPPAELEAGSLGVMSIRTLDDDGKWGITQSHIIYVQEEVEPEETSIEDIVYAEYFFDNVDPGAGNGTELPIGAIDTEINFEASISTQGLQTGPHLMNVRVRDVNGTWSILRTQEFSIEFIIPPALPDELYTIVSAEYFIGDEDPGVGNAIPMEIPIGANLSIQRTAEVSDLEEGTYKISTRTRDITGQWSVTKSRYFDIVPAECEVPIPDFTFNAANAGETVNLTNTSQNVDGSTTYVWDIGADGSDDFSTQNASVVFEDPGVYDVKLTVNNGEDCTLSIIKQVEIGPVLDNMIVANGATTFCAGNFVTLTAPAGSGFVWNTLANSQSIVVSEAGSYSCTYVDENGNQAFSNSVQVVVHPAVEVLVHTSAASNGQANGSAAVFASAGSSVIYSYNWSDGYEGQVNTELLSGVYQVTVSDGVCPETVDVNIENENAAGLALLAGEYFLGDDPGVGAAIPLLIPQTEDVNTFADISTDGLEPGYYLLSARFQQSDGNWGTTRTIPINIFDPNPTVVEDVLSEVVAAEYFLGHEDPGPGQGIATDPFSADQTILANAIIETLAFDLEPGPVKLSTRVRDANGNWSATKTQDFFIQVEPLPNLSDTEWELVAAEYFIGNEDPGQGAAIPIGMNQGTDVSFNESIDLAGLSPGLKKVTIRVMDGEGKWSVAKTMLFEITPVDCPVPDVSFSNSTPEIGETLTLQSNSSNLLGGATYAWDLDEDGVADSNGNTAELFTPEAGSYFVTLTVDNGDGCVASDTREILVGPAFNNIITNDGALSFCEGGNTVLEAPNGSDYLWNTGAITQNITVSEPGTYSVSYVNVLGTPSYASGPTIEVYPVLDVETTVNHPTNGMDNGSIGVFVSGGSQYTYNYVWSTGEQTPIVTDKGAGTYYLTITDTYCIEYLEIELVDESLVSDLIQAEYFWDTDPGAGNGTGFSIPENSSVEFFAGIETEGLSIGYHTLGLRVKRSSGAWGITQSIPVYLGDPNPEVQPDDAADMTDVEYFVDADEGVGNATVQTIAPNSQFSQNFQISVAELGPGSHTISARMRDENGQWGISKSGQFEVCNPPPIPELLSMSEDVCLGADYTIEIEESDFDVIWIRPDGSTVQADNLELTELDISADGAYQVFAQSEPGCFSPSAIFELNVLLPPVIENLIEGAPAVCKDEENAVFFIPPVEFASIYEWQFPEAGEIITGNNTNNIAIDFAAFGGSQATIELVTLNICGSDTASPFIQVFECNEPCIVDGVEGVLIDGECVFYDCNNILGGDAYVDDCGVCNSNPFDDNESCAVIVEGAIASLFICTDSDVRFELYQPGTETLVQEINSTVSADGTFDFGVVQIGEYDVFVKVDGYLNKGIPNVSLENMAESIDFGILDPGDFLPDNIINAADFTLFANVYFANEGDFEYNALFDLNCDAVIDETDFNLLIESFFLEGDNAPIFE